MRFFLSFLWIVFCLSFPQAQLPFTQSNLPIIVIGTNGQSIPDEPKIPADMGIIYHDNGQPNFLSEPFNAFQGLVGIERRGSTSQDLSEKTPYAIELWTATGEDTSVSLLGMPEENDWILLAPFTDKTMMRDAITYLWAGKMMAWAPRTKFCELVLNGQYKGVYILTEKIKRDENRVNISKLDPDENEGDDLTGGYLLKIDKCTGQLCDGFYSAHPFSGTNEYFPFYQYHYPKPEDITYEQKSYIAQWMAGFEDMLASPDFDDPVDGFQQWIDPATFADFLLINELTKNVDGYRLSTFFYKDKESTDGRMKMGPVWDFNIALGNADYCNAQSPIGWALDFNLICPGDYWQIPFWWQRLINDSDTFRNLTKARWLSLRQQTLSNEQIFHDIDSIAGLLSAAQMRNFQLYPILNQYVWPNPFIGGSYAAEVAHLKDWLEERLAWMDSTMGNLSLGIYMTGKYHDPEVFPNPSSGYVSLDYYARHNEKMEITVYTTAGQLVGSVSFAAYFNGENTYQWNHHLPRGIYLYQITAEGKRVGAGKLVVAE